jgi:hypothetical protein
MFHFSLELNMRLTIGQDLSCYATIEIPEDTPLTRETLGEIVHRVVEEAEWQGKEVEFETDWSTTCAARVVCVQDENQNYLVEDMAIDPSPFDAGQGLMNWLRGYGTTFEGVINTAAEAKLIDEPVMELHRGTLKLPGAESIEVEFEVRKGATREEKDLAFLKAVAQPRAIATVDYDIVQEAHHGA